VDDSLNEVSVTGDSEANRLIPLSRIHYKSLKPGNKEAAVIWGNDKSRGTEEFELSKRYLDERIYVDSHFPYSALKKDIDGQLVRGCVG